MEESSWIEIVKLIVTIAGGIVAFLYGRKEYLKSIEIKRAEFLDKLISDFLDKGTEIARNMLDDYVYVKKENRGKHPLEQKTLAIPLKTYLRNHKEEKKGMDPIGRDDEFDVRKSFDSLLDFFTKLSYYLRQDLITPAELGYFKYYLLKLEEKKDDVEEYIDTYFYKNDIQVVIDAVKSLLVPTNHISELRHRSVPQRQII